jgi:hypothetical protein
LWKDRTGATTWPYFGDVSTELFRLYTPDLSEQVVIPAGTTAELIGVWRRIEIPGGPIALEPGGYALGGLDHEASMDSIKFVQFGDEEPPLSSGVKVVVGAPGPGEQFGFAPPSIFFLVRGVEVGPMLFLKVPEPSSGALAAISIASIARRRQSRQFN